MCQAKAFKRFVASGAIYSEGEKSKLCGIEIASISADASTVNLYDSTGTSVNERFFSCRLQPGTSHWADVCYLIRNGGYVEITGTAEVFLYFN